VIGKLGCERPLSKAISAAEIQNEVNLQDFALGAGDFCDTLLVYKPSQIATVHCSFEATFEPQKLAKTFT